MKIEVVVKAGAKKEEVLFLSENKFRVSVKERAIEGKANEAVRTALAGYFNVSRSKIVFLQGLKVKYKRVEITDGL